LCRYSAGEGAPRRESGYRIRKQPKPGFLSTAECIAAALREAEPGDDACDEGGESINVSAAAAAGAEEEGAGARVAPGEVAARAVEAGGCASCIQFDPRLESSWFQSTLENLKRDILVSKLAFKFNLYLSNATCTATWRLASTR
jgi:hypothetical protein